MSKDCIDDIVSLFNEIYNILHHDRSKHSADITASKAVIYPRLDRMKELLYDAKSHAYSCSECHLWKDAEDMRVADETIDRVCSWLDNPVHYDSLMSIDEANNLRTVFDRYIKRDA